MLRGINKIQHDRREGADDDQQADKSHKERCQSSAPA
jgi:hypothetical protein